MKTEFDQVLPNIEDTGIEWHKKNLARSEAFHKQMCEDLGLSVEDVQILVRDGVQ